MGKATTFTVVDHSGNAGYISWRDEFIAGFISAGAVLTTDTGQYTPGSGTRPAINTTGDNAILRTPDSTLYIKVETGTGSVANYPRILVTVGTGSNGSGVITGQTNTASSEITVQNPPVNTITQYNSAWCVLNGYMGVSWKENAQQTNVPLALMILGRTVDSTQAITTTGFGVIRKNVGTGLSVQSVRTAATSATSTDVSLAASPFALTSVPGAVSSSLDSSGNNQAYPCMIAVKDVERFLWAVAIVSAEVAVTNQFSVAIIGTTPRTYRAVNNGITQMSPVNNSAYGLAMLWE